MEPERRFRGQDQAGVFSRRERPVKSCVDTGVRSTCTAIVLAIVYGMLFPYLTAGPPAPRNENVRYQTGFGLSPFSLTAEAQQVAADQHLRTKEELMLALGAYGEGQTSLVWKRWTIFAAGALLIGIFVATYVCWTSGLAWLACALKQPVKRKKRTSEAKNANL
jgi:hypothetical protein